MRVVGGWVLGFGIGLFVVTFKELGSVHPPSGAITAVVLLATGTSLLTIGSFLYSRADRSDRLFFSKNTGTEILASRRRRQVRLETTRTGLLIVTVLWAACWRVFAGGYTCVDDVCEGFVPHQEGLMESFMWLCLLFGLMTLITATLARVHGNETDRWEELASDYLRRRDDGPVPGLKRSRWE